jgi:hypothetical protein
LLAASFIPPQGQPNLRDLPRYRTKLVQERSREVNRVQGVLERANIKLASVATDIMGVSGPAILAALIAGRAETGTMAELAKGRMQTKLPLLEQALTGLMRDHHRRLLTWQLAHSDVLDEQIETLGVESTRGRGELEAEVPPSPNLAGPTGEVASTGDRKAPSPPVPFTQAIAVLDTSPGVDQRGAELLVAEWGHRYATRWHGQSPVGLDGGGPRE